MAMLYKLHQRAPFIVSKPLLYHPPPPGLLETTRDMRGVARNKIIRGQFFVYDQLLGLQEFRDTFTRSGWRFITPLFAFLGQRRRKIKEKKAAGKLRPFMKYFSPVPFVSPQTCVQFEYRGGILKIKTVHGGLLSVEVRGCNNLLSPRISWLVPNLAFGAIKVGRL